MPNKPFSLVENRPGFASRRAFMQGTTLVGLALTSTFLLPQDGLASPPSEEQTESQQTTAEALSGWKSGNDPCAVVRRTQVVKVLNSSRCGIVIAFQRLDSTYVPSGYEATTNTYPTCSNISPATDCLTDPCRSQVALPRLPIAAERANCSVKFICGGQEHDVNCDEQVAPQGKYFVTVGWQFVPGNKKGALPIIKFRSTTADLPKTK